MTDDLKKRLDAHGSRELPGADPIFADRLESQLRQQHAELAPTARPLAGWLPRFALGALVLVTGIAGIVALTSRDAGIPLEVVEGDPPTALDQPETEAGEPDEVVVVAPSPTVVPASTVVAAPTPTPLAAASDKPAVATPTAIAQATAIPIEPTPTVAVQPAATETAPTATPTAIPTSTPTPTPTMQPVAATPVPLPTATVEPTATSTPEPSPTPTVTPEPMRLTCDARRSGDQVGVVCSWGAVANDRVTHYVVVRSRNGGEAAVVSRQRANIATTYIDRDVAAGDELIYLVRAVGANDAVVAASVRAVVSLAP